MADVTLQHVDKFFGDVQVVRDLSLDVEDGELMVLVGPSGCGKSTTLRMIAGLEDASEGTLKIGGRVVNALSPRERDIAMVFQSYALYPHMSVFDNMAFGLKLRKLPSDEIKTRVHEAAALLELSDLLQRRPKALSGGQRQRVAMGRAVVREPAVFLFDEPLSNLDAKLRVQMRLEVARLHKRLAATIVYVTHDQVEAMTLADRIAVMHNGVLQQCATPDSIYQQPANTFVATFIGSPAMNLWPIEASLDDNGEVRWTGAHLRCNPKPTLAAACASRLTATEPVGQWTIGVRPQHLEAVDGVDDADTSLLVDVVEPLGAETFVYGTLQRPTADIDTARDVATMARLTSANVVRLPASSPVRPGDLLHLRLDTERAHLFERDGARVPIASDLSEG